jgi:glutathione S-transferase
MRLYGDPISGNCLKVKDTADCLGLPYAWIDVDVVKGEAKAPDFVAKFPTGQVPAVEFDDGRRLTQSNAIIRYLARGSSLLPDDPFAQAQVDEWLFWEQYEHEPTIAVCRFHLRYLGKAKSDLDPARVARGETALDRMEAHLAAHPWFVGDGLTVADIALNGYTQFAHEGGFDLAGRPAIRDWLVRVRAALDRRIVA